MVLAGFLVIFPGVPCFADQATPDSTPSVEVDIYGNILETNDRLFIIYANIPYGTTPDEPVTEAFIWSLIDTDGVTTLGTTTGFSFVDNGYGYNVYSFYFSAAEALSWNTAYTVRLSGNPTIFDTPPVYNYPVDNADYADNTSSVRTSIAERVLYLANQLNIEWNLSASSYLTYESEIGSVLSILGESFFRNAIYGLQSLAPSCFRFNLSNVTDTTRTWDTEYTDNLSSQSTGTWVEDAQSGGAAMLNTSYDLATIILVVVIAVAVFFATMALSKGDVWASMIDAGLVLILTSRTGMFDAVFVGLLVAISWLYISLKVWGFIK